MPDKFWNTWFEIASNFENEIIHTSHLVQKQQGERDELRSRASRFERFEGFLERIFERFQSS